MTFYGVDFTLKFGNYHFDVAFDSGNECGLEQRDVHWREKGAPEKEAKFLRSFYFDDANERYIGNFCKKFATNEEYRSACLAKTVDWAVRDGLFQRNIFPEFWDESPVTKKLRGEENVYKFIKQHWQTIINLPEYQRIQQIDTQFDPMQGGLDPEIADAVHLFNKIPGVVTKFSCQGVTGTVEFQGCRFMTDSPHFRLGYITFAALPDHLIERFKTDLPESITFLYGSRFGFSADLKSTGDNLAFRRDILELARTLLNAASDL